MGLGMSGHQRPSEGATDDWITPQYILDALGKFDLDPCASFSQPWSTAEIMWTENGLDRSWFDRVWMNPPYGPRTYKWLKKLGDHGNGIALIFARTETKGFFTQVWCAASALLFLRGRLTFFRPDGSKGNSGAPSVLVAYGAENANCLEHCSLSGAFVKNVVVK